MPTQKIIGFLLLILGLIVIFYSLFSSYNIFNGKNSVPEIFKIDGKNINLNVVVDPKKTVDPQAQLEEMLQKNVQKQLQDILPAGTLPKLLNLITWSIFASILFFGGGQISSLGIKLIRK